MATSARATTPVRVHRACIEDSPRLGAPPLTARHVPALCGTAKPRGICHLARSEIGRARLNCAEMEQQPCRIERGGPLARAVDQALAGAGGNDCGAGSSGAGRPRIRRSSSPSITSRSSSRRVTASSCWRCSVSTLRARVVRLGHDSLDFRVDQPAPCPPRRAPRSWRQPRFEEPRALLARVVDGADGVAHAPLGDHRAGDVGGALQVVLRAGRNLAKRDLLGRAAAQQHGELVPQVGARHQIRSSSGSCIV